MYICVVLILPEILIVNRISKICLSLPFFFFMGFYDSGSLLDPSILYALWYVGGVHLGLPSTFQPEHIIIGPLGGAVIAGLLCPHFFPDDSLG